MFFFLGLAHKSLSLCMSLWRQSIIWFVSTMKKVSERIFQRWRINTKATAFQLFIIGLFFAVSQIIFSNLCYFNDDHLRALVLCEVDFNWMVAFTGASSQTEAGTVQEMRHVPFKISHSDYSYDFYTASLVTTFRIRERGFAWIIKNDCYYNNSLSFYLKLSN